MLLQSPTRTQMGSKKIGGQSTTAKDVIDSIEASVHKRRKSRHECRLGKQECLRHVCAEGTTCRALEGAACSIPRSFHTFQPPFFHSPLWAWHGKSTPHLTQRSRNQNALRVGCGFGTVQFRNRVTTARRTEAMNRAPNCPYSPGQNEIFTRSSAWALMLRMLTCAARFLAADVKA